MTLPPNIPLNQVHVSLLEWSGTDMVTWLEWRRCTSISEHQQLVIFLSDQAKYCFRLCQILSINYKKWTHSFLYFEYSTKLEWGRSCYNANSKKKKILTLNQIFGFLKKPSSVSPFFKRKWLLFWARDHSSITLSRFRPTHKPYRFTVL